MADSPNWEGLRRQLDQETIARTDFVHLRQVLAFTDNKVWQDRQTPDALGGGVWSLDAQNNRDINSIINSIARKG
jgi:hypothetical protein